MQSIDLLSCLGCHKIIDQFTMGSGCKDCGGKFFRQVNPTKKNLIKWFIAQPIHVCKLYIQDLREKSYE